MLTGRVIQFNEARGYGFIAPDGGGEDVFLHSEELKACRGSVRTGTRVQFEVTEGERGYKAFDVSVLDASTSAPGQAPSDRASGPEPAEEDLSEVISAAEYAGEITDAIIASCPDATASQIIEIRQSLVASARKRGWLDG